MKVHSTNYYNTLIEISEDSDVQTASVPPVKGENKTIAYMQYEMIQEHPYKYSSDEVIFSIYSSRKGIDSTEIEAARADFFSKGQPCLRTSPLAKKSGWGIHSDASGRLALYSVESSEYEALVRDESVKKIKAMRSKRK